MSSLLRKIVKKFIRLRGGLTHARGGGGGPALCGKPGRIAYFVAGGIGDGVMAFPAIDLLRQTFPGALLDVFVPPSKHAVLAALFDGCPTKPFSSSCFLALLAGRRYDVAFTNAVAAFKVRVELAAWRCARRSFGFRYAEEQERDRLYSGSLAMHHERHDIDQNLDLVAASCGASVSDGQRRLPAHPVHPHGKMTSVIVHPGAEKGYEYKRWPVDRFRVIVRKLLDEGCAVTILAGPSEEEIGEEFAGMPATVLRDADADTLLTAFRAADIFVGNDSGPAHIAAWFGLSTITLIGPVSPQRSAPRGDRCTYLYSKESCSPCHFSAVACAHRRCMTNITVEHVWEAVTKAKESL